MVLDDIDEGQANDWAEAGWLFDLREVCVTPGESVLWEKVLTRGGISLGMT